MPSTLANPQMSSPAQTPQQQVVSQNAAGAKIAFFGIFGIQNLGNECTLQAIVYNARKRMSDGQFCAISYNPSDTRQRHALAAFPITNQDFSKVRPGKLARVLRILFKRPFGELRDWLRAVRNLRGTRLVIMTGTGMLTDYSTTAFSFPYDVFRWTAAARLAGCKVRFVGVGVGPMYQSLSRLLIRSALRLADYRSFRDEFSKNRIAKIFDSSNDHVFPDLAFSLPSSIFPARRDCARQKPQIGLGVMEHRDIHLRTSDQQREVYSAYLDKMCDFVEWLVQHDYQVRILQGDAKHDGATRTELRARLAQRGIRYENSGIFDEGGSSVEEILDQISRVEIVVSPRFHNLLLGLMMNIPAISLSYDPKSDALLEGMGLGKYRQEIFELDVQLLIQHVTEIQARMREIRPVIAGKADEYRRLLDRQYDLIFDGA